MTDRAEDIALFRYGLVREAADPKLSKAERGNLVRALAAQPHTGPGGEVGGGVPHHARPLGAGLSPRWLCRPTPRPAPGRAPHAGRSIGAGRQAAKRRPPPQRGPHRRSAPGRPGLVAPPPHPGAPLQGIGPDPGRPHRRQRGLWALPGRLPQRAVDRRRPARAGHRGQESHLVRLHRRLQPNSARAPLELQRGHPGRPGRAAPGHPGPGPAFDLLPRQRQPVRVPPAVAGPGRARGEAGPQPARAPRRQGQDRTLFQDRARTVPGRGGPQQGHGLGGPRRAFRGLARAVLPPPPSHRDRRGAPGAVLPPGHAEVPGPRSCCGRRSCSARCAP